MSDLPLLHVDGIEFTYPGRRRLSVGGMRPRLHRVSGRQVLNGVSLAVRAGETLAVIGTNGCGKSTLIKVMAGAFVPQRGTRTVRGSLAAMVELGAGFDTELSVHDNILLYGALNGQRVSAVREEIPAILDWADLTDVEWEPVRTLSSGMTARLGFSVATHFLPDILLVDEVLSVGDARFREKSEARMRRLVDSGAAVVIVTHDMDVVRGFATSGMWLKGGRVEHAGKPADVVARYIEHIQTPQ